MLDKVSLIVLIAICGIRAQNVTTVDEFYEQIAAYTTADVEIVVTKNLTLASLLNIPASAKVGVTLTIQGEYFYGKK